MIFLKYFKTNMNTIFAFTPIVLMGISEILVKFFHINSLTILSLVLLSASISIYILFINNSKFIKSLNNKSIYIMYTILSIIIIFISNISVNNYIVEFSHVNPSLFPFAQQILFPFVAITWWLMLSYIMLNIIFLYIHINLFLLNIVMKR